MASMQKNGQIALLATTSTSGDKPTVLFLLLYSVHANHWLAVSTILEQ